MDILFIDNISEWLDVRSYFEKYIDKDIIRLELKYSSDFRNAKVLRDFIDYIGKKLSLSNIDIARLILVSDEMNNNAIEYGSKAGELNSMRVFVEKIGTNVDICIEVEDTWNGKKHKTSKQMEKLRDFREEKGYKDHDSIRWRGLFMIIVNIVNELYFRDSPQGGLIVWIKNRITSQK